MNFFNGLKSIITAALQGNRAATNALLRSGALVVGKNTRIDGAQFEVRTTAKNRYIAIGAESVVSGNFYIERQEGRITVGSNTFIGGGMFVSAIGIEIGDDVMISWGCTVMDNDAHSLDWEERKNDVHDWKKGLDEGQTGKYKNWSLVPCKPIKIQDKAWIGFNSIILKGVTIGEGAVVASGSVVTTDVEPFTLVGGNPARLIKRLK